MVPLVYQIQSPRHLNSKSISIESTQSASKYLYFIYHNNSFINKMTTKLNPILSQILSIDNEDYAGVKQCYHGFLDKIKDQMLNDPELKPDIEEHMTEINEYILL